MYFSSKEEFLIFLRGNCNYLGQGSQAVCYLNKMDNDVLKVYLSYMDDNDFYNDDYSEENILRFKDIRNDTFIFATKIIKVGDCVVGSISKYVEGHNLYQINPLTVNLDMLEGLIDKAKQDIKYLSEKNISLYDVTYNIILGNNLYVKDFDEFSYTNVDTLKLEKTNNMRFDYELYLFLVDDYFDDFVKQHKTLNEMYLNKNDDIREFLKLFKKLLSNYTGKDITNLNDASEYLNKVKKYQYKYLRSINKINL